MPSSVDVKSYKPNTCVVGGGRGEGRGTPEVTSGGIFKVLVECLCLQFGCFVLQKKQHVEPIMYMTEWFMCLFTRNLSWGCVLRLWDIFLCEGED